MALALKDRVKETTIVVGTGAATLLGSSIGFQPFSVVGNGNTTYYCISDQFGSNWEVGIGTYTASGTTLARTTVLASSNGGALVVFTAGVKDVFVTYPAEKGVWLDASGNAIGLGTPAAFVGTNITGTASGLTAGNVTTNANLTGAIISTGNATSLGSFTSLQLATALTNETGTGSAVFSDNASLLNPTYTGTLTGGTGILNIGSGQVYKDASGNVGIGTSSPSYRLEVKGASATAGQLSIHDGTGDTTVSGATAGSLLFQARDSSIRTIAEIDAVNTTTNGTGGAMVFQTRISDALAERMRIDSAGNVGIGTSLPATKLHVAGNALVQNTSASLQINSTTTAQARYLNLSNSTDSSNAYLYAVGYGVGLVQADANASSNVYISTQNIERMRIDSSGNVLVGVTAPIGGLNAVGHFKNVNAGAAGIVVGNAGGTSTTNTILFTNSNGTVGGISTSGSATAFNTSSDYRLKNTIAPMTGALDKVVLLKPVTYKWIVDGSDGQGFIAHELAEVCPHAVTGEKDAVDKYGIPVYQGIDTSFLVATLTAAIQELKAIIDTQQEQINSLLGK
jgi:hypothetical protein